MESSNNLLKVDLNNNDLDLFSLHVSRAETDLSAELKRLSMANRPLTPGAPLKRSGKIINFPSQINFDEICLGANSTTDLNGNIDLRRISSLSRTITNKVDLDSSLLTFQVTNELSSKKLEPNTATDQTEPLSVHYASETEKSLLPTTANHKESAKPWHWDIVDVPSNSDKSKGDGGVRSFHPSTLTHRRLSEPGSFGTFETLTVGDTASRKLQTAETDEKPEVPMNPVEPAVEPDPLQPTLSAETNVIKNVESDAGATGFTDDGDNGSLEDEKSSEGDEKKTAGSKSSAASSGESKSSSSKTSKSSKSSGSGTGGSSRTSKSQKSQSVAEDDVVEVIPDCDGRKGAIMFKVPGRLTHKTTIKVSHFPQNGNAAIIKGIGNTECIVEDLVPPEQPMSCPVPYPSSYPNSQNAAAAMQQAMAYQQYCNRNMYCTPYGYYPY